MNESDLRRVVQSLATTWAVPGGVVAVTDRVGTTTIVPFGFSDVARAIPANLDHLFEIGSISKIMTAMSVLQQVDSGRVDLAQPISELLPWLPSPFLNPGITVERLLQHMAGTPASLEAVADEIAQLIGAEVPELQPGVAFHYSNVGFLLLGTAVAAVTGRPFTDVVAEGVLAPAGMAASIARVTNDDRARLATGYWSARSDRPWLPGDALEPSPFLEVAGADGNTAATIGDLAAFARLLLRRAEGVLPSALFDVMIGRTGPGGEEVLALSGVPASSISRYGLGVNVEVVEGRTVLTHGGGMVGYASFLHADLDRGRAVVVVSNANGDSPVAEAIARVIAAEADGSVLDPARWVASGKGLPRAALPSMVGEFGDMTIRAEPDIDGGIALTVTLAGETHPLFWSWGERVLTRHPLLRTFGLRFERGRWMSGSTVFGTLPASIDPDLESLCGRYRSYSPWFPEFRIVQRDGVLRLSMPGGVEAPGEDLPLIRLSDDYYRIGEAVSLPGRLRFGPLVAGVATWVDRDGCRYSRAFTS